MNRSRTSSERALTHVMPIGKGTFVLRYVAFADGVTARVVVTADPDHADGIQLMFSPGAEGGVLRNPGDHCLLSSSKDARILVTTIGSDLTVSDAVTLKLDRIEADPPTHQPRQLPRPPAISPPAGREDATHVPIKLLGHVEMDGDVTVNGGEWLGGHDRQVEGFAIQWPRRPASVDISYGCSIKGIGRLPDGVVGEFVGTRNQARGLNGVSFGLIGQDAPSYKLTVEALFSDGSHYGPEDAPVDFVGRTGREHVVGLSVDLIRVNAAEVAVRRPPSRLNGAKAPPASSRQVRVFRAPKSSGPSHQR